MHAQKKTYPSRRLSHGVGLIEVMIAVLIMGVGLLGIAAMQATALRNNESALERTQATIQTYSILDAMRANRSNVLNYNIAKTCTVPTASATLAQNDLHDWIDSLKETLGKNDGSCGAIACNGVDCTITVYWDDSRATEGTTPGNTVEGDDARFVITKARL